MNMKKRVLGQRILVQTLLLFLVLALPAAGQEREPICDPSLSLVKCWEARETALETALEAAKADAKRSAPAVARTAAREMSEEVQEETTGTAIDAASTALRDNLSNFVAAAGLSGDDQPLATLEQKLFEWRFGCSDSDKDQDESCETTIPFHLKAEVQEPEVLGALEEAIPEEIRSERVASLEEDLDTLDSIDIQLRASLEDSTGDYRLGRDAEDYKDLLQAFYLDASDRVTEPEATAAKDTMTEFLRDATKQLTQLGLGTIETPIETLLAKAIALDLGSESCKATCGEEASEYFERRARCEILRSRLVMAEADVLDDQVTELAACLRAENEAEPATNCRARCATHSVEQAIQPVVEQIEIVAKQNVERRAALRQALRKGRFFEMVDLVDNQPQAYLEINRRERGALSGPEEWSAKLVYEWGMINVNSFRRWAEKDENQKDACGVAASGMPTVGCLGKYMEEKSKYRGDGNRFAFSLEYVKTDDFAFSLPDDGVDFSLDEVEKTIGSIKYGRRLAFDGEGDEKARMDFSLSYEDVSDDPDRQSRTIADFTITRHLVDRLSLSFGFRWANKPEYLGEVDEELSGRVGLNWKVFSSSSDEDE